MIPQRILVIEIKTADNPSLDSSQMSTLTFHQNTGKLYLRSDFEEIKSAISDAVLCLGSNYRHPLYFDVQVIPDKSKSDNPSNRRRRRRRRKSCDEE